MDPKELHVGLIVEHISRPEWGPGRVLDVRGTKAEIYFRDRPRPTVDQATVTLSLQGIAMLRAAADQNEPWLAALPFRNGKITLTHAPLTRDEAVAKFQRHFPEGFQDPGYYPHERTAKLAAHQRFAAFLQGACEQDLLDSNKVAEFTAAVLNVFLPPFNLLHPTFELPRLREALENAEAAPAYYRALLRFLETDELSPKAFDRYAQAVESLPASPDRPVANWPVATILPFIARPDIHMLLRPGMSERAAQWLGVDLGYESKLNFRTYERLLQLTKMIWSDLERRGDETLRPRDYIDIQSFMWVVAGYP